VAVKKKKKKKKKKKRKKKINFSRQQIFLEKIGSKYVYIPTLPTEHLEWFHRLYTVKETR